MTPDIQFLINCCKNSPTAGEIKEIREYLIATNTIDLQSITALAHLHSVMPLFNQALQTHASDLLEANAQAKIKQYSMDIVMQNMRMAAELKQALKQLAEHGINALPFKGPILAQLAYGDITLRQYCDLDILIQPEDLKAGSQILVKMGYRPRVSLEFLDNQAFLDVNHDIGFYKDITIEFHWRLFEKQLIVQFGQDLIWSELSSVEIYDQYIKTLKVEHLIIYLCIHGSKHAWECLQWVTDIDRLVGKNPDLNWKLIIERSIELEAEQLLLLGLSLSRRFYNTALPEVVQEQLNNNPTVEKLQQIVIDYFNNNTLVNNRGSKSYYHKLTAFRLAMQNTRLAKLKYFYQNLIKVNSADIEALGAKKHSQFRYLLNKPVRLLGEYFRREKA